MRHSFILHSKDSKRFSLFMPLLSIIGYHIYMRENPHVSTVPRSRYVHACAKQYALKKALVHLIQRILFLATTTTTTNSSPLFRSHHNQSSFHIRPLDPHSSHILLPNQYPYTATTQHALPIHPRMHLSKETPTIPPRTL